MSHHQRFITISLNPPWTKFYLPNQNHPDHTAGKDSPLSFSVCTSPTNPQHSSSFLPCSDCGEQQIVTLHGVLGSGGNISVKSHIGHLLCTLRLTCSTTHRNWGETGKFRGLPTLHRCLQSSRASTFPGQKQELKASSFPTSVYTCTRGWYRSLQNLNYHLHFH